MGHPELDATSGVRIGAKKPPTWAPIFRMLDALPTRSATACHHILLTLLNIVDGNPQTAHMMTDDIVTETIPITRGPNWGVPAALAKYHDLYLDRGQFSAV